MRVNPACYYRDGSSLHHLPALLAAITDMQGGIMGLMRTYLTPDGLRLADVPEPKRVMGHLLHHAVRLGGSGPVMTVGEGLETMLSVTTLLPHIPAAAALTANHLGALLLPPDLERLYIAHDADAPGLAAAQRLTDRAKSSGIDVHWLSPSIDDWNDELRRDFLSARSLITTQLATVDRGASCPGGPIPFGSPADMGGDPLLSIPAAPVLSGRR